MDHYVIRWSAGDITLFGDQLVTLRYSVTSWWHYVIRWPAGDQSFVYINNRLWYIIIIYLSFYLPKIRKLSIFALMLDQSCLIKTIRQEPGVVVGPGSSLYVHQLFTPKISDPSSHALRHRWNRPLWNWSMHTSATGERLFFDAHWVIRHFTISSQNTVLNYDPNIACA